MKKLITLILIFELLGPSLGPGYRSLGGLPSPMDGRQLGLGTPFGRGMNFPNAVATENSQAGWAGAYDVYCLRQLAHSEKAEQVKYSFTNPKGQKVVYLVDLPDPSRFPGKRAIVFLFHGLSGFKTEPHLEAFMASFVDEGYVVVRPDFTNNRVGTKPNESGGSLTDFSIGGEIDDAAAVISDLRSRESDRVDFLKVVVGGHSYGGLVARHITRLARPKTGQGDPRFAGLNVCALIDMSGVICPRGTILRAIEKGLKTVEPTLRNTPFSNLVGRLKADRGKWRKTGNFNPYPGQRYYLVDHAADWETYNAAEELTDIADGIAVIVIKGVNDQLVLCTGAGDEEEAEVRAYFSSVSSRKNGCVLTYPIEHAYPPDMMSEILKDIIPLMREIQGGVKTSESPSNMQGKQSEPETCI